MANQSLRQAYAGARRPVIDDSLSVRIQANDKLQLAAKAGWAAKGCLYVTLGVLALLAALGSGGKTADSAGVLQWVAEQSFGTILLVAAGAGFCCYAVWRFMQALIDPESHSSSWMRVIKRSAWIASGIAHIGLGFAAFELAFGDFSSGGEGKQIWLSKALSQPWGPYFVGGLAIALMLVGLYQFKEAWKLGFMKNVNTSKMSVKEEKAFRRVGRVGLAARGVVFPVIGYFLLRAAVEANAALAEGASVGGALDAIAASGALPLALVSAGLIAYGVLQLFFARYRNVPAA